MSLVEYGDFYLDVVLVYPNLIHQQINNLQNNPHSGMGHHEPPVVVPSGGGGFHPALVLRSRLSHYMKINFDRVQSKKFQTLTDLLVVLWEFC